MNRPRDRASASGLLPRMEARPKWSVRTTEAEEAAIASAIIEEWRPWKETGVTPMAWIADNWRSFVHGPTVASLAVAHHHLDSVSGVYLLFKAGRLVYVGESVNTSMRFIQHEATKSFDAAWAFRVPELYRNDVESSYIEALAPPLNVADERLP